MTISPQITVNRALLVGLHPIEPHARVAMLIHLSQPNIYWEEIFDNY
jgi:hypothetical protein